jgi:site-specific recombinase XerD
MPRALQPVTINPAAIATLVEQTRKYVENAKSDNTKRAYQADWRHFTAWCEQHRVAPLPAAPATVGYYLAALAGAGYKSSTLTRRLASIAEAHRSAGFETPTTSAEVKAVWSGIRRTHGTAQAGKSPAVTADIKAMISALDVDQLAGVRDRAILLLGFAGAFRRSELVALDVDDLVFSNQGITVTIRKSKTDQQGAGELRGIPRGQFAATCPVRAVRDWLNRAGITSGPVFRPIDRHGTMAERRLSDQAVALIVKRAATSAGLDASGLSGHSLRAGFATSAAAVGVEERDIMKQTGHRSTEVMRRYIRGGSIFRNNAASKVGL